MLNIFEAIAELVVEKYPELLTGMCLVVFSWFLTSRWERLYGRFKFTKNQSNAIRNTYLPDLHNKFASMDQKLNSIDTTLQKISVFLVTKFGLDSDTFKSKSPIGLTEIGNDLLKLSGGKDYVDRSMSYFFMLVEKEAPRSGLDHRGYVLYDFASVVVKTKSLYQLKIMCFGTRFT